MNNQPRGNKSRAFRSVLTTAGVLALTGAALICAVPAAQAQGNANGGKTVTINLQNAPVQTVLRSLFKSAGQNFTIDPSVTGTVNVDVNGVSFQQALDAILSGTNPPLDATLTNGIYHVAIQQAQQAAPPSNAPSTANNTTPSTATDPHHAYRIPISHYDASYMAYLVAAFSRKGGAPIIVPSDPTGQQYGLGGGGAMGGGGMGGYGGGMGGGMMGGMGGGMMGGMGGMMGGMGGFGGGMGGFGGGMGGFGGGMGGFGGGGMGGFGGGGMGGFGGGGFGRGY